MANISQIKIGSTTYDISSCLNISSYCKSGGTLPADYYKYSYRKDTQPVECKLVTIPDNSNYKGALETGNHIVFAFYNCPGINRYYRYYVFKESNRGYVGEFSVDSAPKALNVAFGVSLATTTTEGLMSAADKSKLNSLDLDNIATGLNISRDSSAVSIALCNDDEDISGTYNIPAATTARAGVMSATDKSKLDAISDSGVVFADQTYDMTVQINKLLFTSMSTALSSLNIDITLRELAKYPCVSATIDESTLTNGVRIAPGRYKFILCGVGSSFTDVKEAYLIGKVYYIGDLNSITEQTLAIRLAYQSYGHGIAEWGINGYSIS